MCSRRQAAPNHHLAVQGASVVALGKAKAGARYLTAVYVMGVINGMGGVYRSCLGGTCRGALYSN